MKKASLILSFLSPFLITACSSSYVVSSSGEDTSVDEFNELAEGEEADIILLNSTVITASEVYLSADSLHWFNTETKSKAGAAKSEIGKVIFTDDMWRRGLRGATYGCGAGIIFWVAVNDSLENSQFVDYMEGIAAFGVVGALIGFPIGMIVGHTDEYGFENDQHQEDSGTSLTQMTNNRSSQFYKRKNR